MPDEKLTVCVDLDGVLAQYDGWKGVDHIGEPFEGAKEFMNLLRLKYKVVVFTTRTKENMNREKKLSSKDLAIIVRRWLEWNFIPYDGIYVGQGKPVAVAYIDDRAVSCVPKKHGTEAYSRALTRVKQLDDHVPSKVFKQDLNK